MRHGIGLVAVVVASIIAGVLGSVRADDQASNSKLKPLVVIVSMEECCAKESWPQVESHLRSELMLLDIEVEVIAGTARDETARRRELEQITWSRQAIAALRIMGPGNVASGWVEIWIADRLTGKTTYRRVELDRKQTSNASTIVAVRAVEALRASLLELRIVGGERSFAEPPEEIEAFVESVELEGKSEGPANFGVSAGGQAAGGPGGAGLKAGFRLAGCFIPVSWLALELEVTVLPFGREIATYSGRTELDAAALRGWLLWQILGQGLVRPLLGVGGGIWSAWVRGIEAEGRSLLSDHALLGYAGVTGRLQLAVHEHLWLTGGVQVGILVPELRVLHGQDEAARIGRPVIEGILGVDVRF